MRIPNWPGQQINDINEFRTACYKTCHDTNPTDSGWYEKEDECGRNCALQLRAFQKQSGKNPCAQRLQAPVFWFDNQKNIKENYQLFNETKSGTTSRLDMIYLILLSVFLLFLFVAILSHLLKK